jgi:DNA-binding NtrC family response regulator
MSLSAQAKVLRVLQENRIQRVGSDKDIKVDVRVVAATNKNLKEEILAGRFREDLYHRLAVILIKVPSLNERRSDIPLLIDYFSSQISNSQGDGPKVFSAEAVDLLKQYDWTGNIRELRNVVERLMILGGPLITAEDVRLFAAK